MEKYKSIRFLSILLASICIIGINQSVACSQDCLFKHSDNNFVRYTPSVISTISSGFDGVIKAVALNNWDGRDRADLLQYSSYFSIATLIARSFVDYSYMGKYVKLQGQTADNSDD